jgi:hypothetical protein
MNRKFLLFFTIVFALNSVVLATANDTKKSIETPVKQAKVVNINLFTINNIAKEKKDEEKKDSISVVDAKKFKVSSFSELLTSINEWWNDILQWFSREKTNVLVLFVGIFLTFLVVGFLGWLFGKVIMGYFIK